MEMTVKQLRDLLENYHDNEKVVISTKTNEFVRISGVFETRLVGDKLDNNSGVYKVVITSL